jgi:uncharacterized protein (DUF2267 family)
MQYRELLKQVQRDGPMENAQQAERAVAACLRVLAPCLPRELAAALAKLFPADVSAAPESPAPMPDLATFYARAGRYEGASVSRVVEHVQVVCAALGRQLEPELRERLQRTLPAEVAALFAPAPHSTLTTPHLGHSQTLAEGQPGSAHPLSSARPGSRHPVSTSTRDDAQQQSVENPNPHGNSKLSSSQGLTQEREKESLAEGRSKKP